MALLGDLIEELGLGVLSVLQAPDLVGSRNEFGEKLLDFRVRPDRLPGYDSVVSRTGQRVAVRRPEQDGFSLLGRFADGGVKSPAPADRFEGAFFRLGRDVVPPLGVDVFLSDRQ